MFYTEIGLTQYEMHDKFNPLVQYNNDMQIITTTVTVASGEITKVNEKIEREVEQLNERIDENGTRLDEHDTEIESIKAKDLEQDNNIGMLEAGVRQLDVVTTSISSALIEHMETAVNENAALTAEIKKVNTDLSAKIAADGERIAVNETAIAGIKDDLYGTVDDPTGLRGEIQHMKQDISANETNIDNLQRINAQHEIELQSLSRVNTTQDGKILSNINKITTLEGQVAALEQSVEDVPAILVPDSGNEDTINKVISYKNYRADEINISGGLCTIQFDRGSTQLALSRAEDKIVFKNFSKMYIGTERRSCSGKLQTKMVFRNTGISTDLTMKAIKLELSLALPVDYDAIVTTVALQCTTEDGIYYHIPLQQYSRKEFNTSLLPQDPGLADMSNFIFIVTLEGI